MSGIKPAATLASTSPRPNLKSHLSASLPSTPNQRPRDRASPPGSPSAKRNTSNPSPRPHYSDSLPLPRKLVGGCKYETGMANAKRRVPYSLGPDKLDADPEVPKPALSPAEDARLTADMGELYNHLLSPPESEDRRKRLVEKLEIILRNQWPGYTITVNVFGSTGNKLGTTDSDVDICITTDCKELEHVCVLAEFLANQGMQRVVCISAAKVPIVKIWDPELRLACDMNVNNPVALENTAMIRAYVDIDERVRPLAMIIKHWTKRRVLNEAALGGTLSSYAWICMIINFLQTRSPPILPALQQGPLLEKKFMCGLNVAFDKNTDQFQGYGSKNPDSLGKLLFQFFRYYGHEIDFEISVMSVRAGRVITKGEKNWHFLQDNRLCVEEPFNTSRNLGNTADDTSVRGIHLELRRAFKMVSEARLAKCCEEYEAPSNLIDEVRPFERQSASSRRPTIAHPAAPAGRAGRGGGRGGRPNSLQRNSNSTRRASSASTRGYAQPLPLGNSITPTDLSLQAQHRQFLLHDQLFLQYQYLQAQEQELRAQLHQQAFLQGRIVPTCPYPHIALPYGAFHGGQEELVRTRAAMIGQPPLTAPIRPQGFSLSSSYGGRTPVYGSTTNPPSPLLQSILPDSRRTYRRSSMTTGSSGGSLRAQSQPPRPLPSPLSFPGAVDPHTAQMPKMTRDRLTDPSTSSGIMPEFADPLTGGQRRYYQTSSDRRGSEYMGYYLGHSPPLPMYSRSVAGSPYATSTGLGIQTGGISPQVLAHSPSNPVSMPPLISDVASSPTRGPETSRSEARHESRSSYSSKRPTALSRSSSGPVVVNGSIERKTQRYPSAIDLHGSLNTGNFDASGSDDVAVDTPTSSDDFDQGFSESHVADKVTIAVQGPHLAHPGLPAGQEESSGASRSDSRHVNLDTTVGESVLTNGSCSIGKQAPDGEQGGSAGPNATIMIAGVSPEDGKLIHTSALQLSPVKELRTPSPNRGLQLPTGEDSNQAASKSRAKGKGKSKKSSILSGEPSEDKAEALAVRPNGSISSSQISHPAGGKVSVNGWQTQKKKSKHQKGSKSETDLQGIKYAGGEALPLIESMRKGG